MSLSMRRQSVTLTTLAEVHGYFFFSVELYSLVTPSHAGRGSNFFFKTILLICTGILYDHKTLNNLKKNQNGHLEAISLFLFWG